MPQPKVVLLNTIGRKENAPPKSQEPEGDACSEIRESTRANEVVSPRKLSYLTKKPLSPPCGKTFNLVPGPPEECLNTLSPKIVQPRSSHADGK